MKQYMLTVHDVEGSPVPAPEVLHKMYADVEAVNAELQSAGVWVFAGGLHPPTTATVVKVQDGDVLTTDGPFAEGKEHVGGFWVIKVPDLDAALAWAAKATVACAAPVEVRPFQDDFEEA
ncbi:MAG: hypothetical protein QOJ93_367 [Actinomycetota bacterium]|jgi:hypothetical protein|nr:hypothetical protein [Actinomycetota bacterium]